MREETIAQLRRISTPKIFKKDEYICYEGQPGSEMYIVLRGSVGVFVTNVIGILTQVATIPSGDFFGEMAIFDNLPRSASCIALEDTITVAITQENLEDFLRNCPEMAKQVLENMSERIRRLDDELYKNNRFVKNRHVPRFEIPSVYKNGHVVKEPYQDPQFLMKYKQACPICGKAVSVVDLKRNILEMRNFETDCRVTYVGCEPLWCEVITCPHCYYTNHYLRFFGINNFEYEEVEKVLRREHKPIVELRLEKRSGFDLLVMRYLQAIHINEHINPGANGLIGGLWRNLYWLSKDVSDKEFALYCAKKAIEKYCVALDENEFFDLETKTTTALTLVNLQMYCGEEKNALKYLAIATESPNEVIRNKAIQVKTLLERRMQIK